MLTSIGKLGDRLLGRFVPAATAKANVRPNTNCSYCGPCTNECPGGTLCCDDGHSYCMQN